MDSRTLVRGWWRTNALLTAVGFLMLVDFVLSLAGLVLDARVITGMPAWLKPAKFGISTAIYSFTILWLLSYIRKWPALVRVFTWIVAVVFLIEIVIIDVQAVRGSTSHFNQSTPLDAGLFHIMGVSIGILWLASAGIAVALFCQKFADVAWGWALRLGLLITLLGALTGVLMVVPTQAQIQASNLNHAMPVAGAHTVGAPDGGPGLPFTGWSKEHGDLRVPHFLGLHATQLLPLMAWVFGISRRSARQRLHLVFVAAATYFALLVILTWQALRGQSVINPDTVSVTVFAVWALASAAAFAACLISNHRPLVAEEFANRG